jgi:ribosomal protein S18 acetylase RimI-like enzyme
MMQVQLSGGDSAAGKAKFVAGERLAFQLFAEEKRAELAVAGLPESQVETLVEMQFRGRQTTYTERYPAAEDLVMRQEDGSAAGRLLLDKQPGRWRVVDIAVLRACRGRGLAPRAMQDCQRQCGAAGAWLELQVQPGNPARRLYERLGFRAVSENAVAVEMVWVADRRSSAEAVSQ